MDVKLDSELTQAHLRERAGSTVFGWAEGFAAL